MLMPTNWAAARDQLATLGQTRAHQAANRVDGRRGETPMASATLCVALLHILNRLGDDVTTARR